LEGLTLYRMGRCSMQLRITGARRNHCLIKQVQRPLQPHQRRLSVRSVQLGTFRKEYRSQPNPLGLIYAKFHVLFQLGIDFAYFFVMPNHNKSLFPAHCEQCRAGNCSNCPSSNPRLFTEPFRCELRGESRMSYHKVGNALISRGGST
jgi:hypothetical protein